MGARGIREGSKRRAEIFSWRAWAFAGADASLDCLAPDCDGKGQGNAPIDFFGNTFSMIQLRQAEARLSSRKNPLYKGLLVAVALFGLDGCRSLAVSGPTGSAVIKASRDNAAGMKFQLVEVENAGALPSLPERPTVEALVLPPPATDTIGAGDTIEISVYEAGVALFAAGGARAVANGGAPVLDSGAQVAHLSPQRVDDQGFVYVPYAGRLRAAGHTPAELGTIIARALRGKSQDPQVSVTIAQAIANTVILGGEISHPGRLVLNTNRESLADAIALAGGYRGDAKDLLARVVRRGRMVQYRLSDVLSGPERDMTVQPGDRIEIVREPQSFEVLGAAGKVELMTFPSAALNLAEGVAMAGGANPYMGDAKAIFVFRFVPGPDGKETGVVYHLNMMKPGAYLLSQRFVMRDKDVLYVGNAAANQPAKLIQLVSQLFSPIATIENTLVNTNVIQ